MTATLEAPTRLISAEEAEQWLGRGQWELIDGQRVTTFPTGEEHGEIATYLVLALKPFVKRHRLGRLVSGDVGYVVGRNPDSVRAPEIAFTRRSRTAGKPKATWAEVVPDLVVEVTSPGDRPAEVRRKCEMWLAVGVQVVWEVRPDSQSVMVYEQGVQPRVVDGSGSLEANVLLPDFRVYLADIFDLD